VFIAALLLIAEPQSGREPLVSPVYEVVADKETITRHAIGCVNQNATSGRTDIPTIESSDMTVGTVVAINFLQRASISPFSRDMRTALRIDARDGQFRIVNSNFELFSEWKVEWSPIKRSDRPWAELEGRLNRQSERLASCIRDAAADW
jgi:hypothetical protein